MAAIAITLLLAVALDLRRAPSEQWTTAAAVSSIHLYQATLSPIYGKLGVQCKFTVTCSHYGEAVVKRFGIVRGGWMAAKRVLRCGPWTPPGSVDNPPA